MNKQSFLDNAYSIYNDNIIYTIADIIYNDIDCNVYVNNNLINVIYPSKKIEVIIFINYSVPFKEYVQNYVISKARNGIRCIVIFKHELLNKQIIIRDIVQRALNIHTKSIIYARNNTNNPLFPYEFLMDNAFYLFVNSVIDTLFICFKLISACSNIFSISGNKVFKCFELV